jgi:hypothetical protein
MQRLVVSRFKFGLPLKVTFPLSSLKTLNDLPDLTKNRWFIKLKSYWLERIAKATSSVKEGFRKPLIIT